MIKLSIFMLLVHSTFAISSEICSVKFDGALPQIDNSLEDMLNNVTNREFDPCKELVEPVKNKKELCLKDAKYFQNILCQKNGKMGFWNKKGLFGLPTGVCWWHSQFHRNATYTTYYAPDEPKLNPDKKEDKEKLKKIINNIVRLKKISKIPGYSSLREFTSDPKIEKLIQKRLQHWMSEDSFLKMEWTKGLTIPNNYSTKSKEYFMKQRGYKYDPFKDYGDDKTNAKAARQFERKTYQSKEKELAKKEKTLKHQSKEIEELFTSVNQKDQIGYVTLQYPGVMAHASIVFDAKKQIINGETVYDFKVQDSNYQGDRRESLWERKAYSQIRFKDGVWYANSQPGKMEPLERYYEPINIKVHNSKDLNKIDKLYQEECSKSLF